MTPRNTLIATFGFVAVLAATADARPRPGGHIGGRSFEANKTFGLGLELGEPTGVTGKYFLSASNALDFGLGTIYNYFDRDGLHLYLDYLWHPVSLISNESFELPFYVGVGGRFWNFTDRPYDNAYAFGVRVPLGIAFDFNNVPLDIFVQIVPTLDFYANYRHSVYLDLDASFGIRYWFN